MSSQPINMTVPSAEFDLARRVSFEPKYTQPFLLREAMELEVVTLVNEMVRLINSITHLYSTQDILQEFLASEEETHDDPESQQAAAEAFRENEVLIPTQSERIAIIVAALINKVGWDMRIGEQSWKAGDVFTRYQSFLPDEKRRKWWESDVPVEAAPEEEGLHL